MFTSGQDFEGRQSPQVSGMSDVVEMIMSQQQWARRVSNSESNSFRHSDNSKQPWKEVMQINIHTNFQIIYILINRCLLINGQHLQKT